MEDITDADYKHAKKEMERFWNKRSRQISWFICLKWYIITCRCIWKL